MRRSSRKDDHIALFDIDCLTVLLLVQRTCAKEESGRSLVDACGPFSISNTHFNVRAYQP